VPLRTRTGAGAGLHHERRAIVVLVRRAIVIFVLIRACIFVLANSVVVELRATSRGVDDSDGEARRR